MLNWLKRIVDRTPELSDDLPPPAPKVVPPPPPPDDLTAGHVAPLAARRGRTLDVETDEVRDLCTQLFDRFRAHPDDLPAFPALAAQIFEIVERPKEQVDIHQLVQVLSREPATSALMLRVANSSRYGGSARIHTVRDAVVRLGIGEVATLAVAAASRALFDPSERAQLEQFQQFWAARWRHALTTAFSAAWLSMETRQGQPQEAFVAGLLHDIGKSLALRVITELAVNGAIGHLRPEVIEFVLESAHVDLGSEAAVRWGLPDFVIEVCQDHHSDEATGLPVVVRLASDVYDLKYNPLHRASIVESIRSAALVLDVDARAFANLAAQVSTFALATDEIAVSPEGKIRRG